MWDQIMLTGLKIAILITSDRASTGEYEDKTIPMLRELIERNNGTVADTKIVPDEQVLIEKSLIEWCENDGIDAILTSGGTGITSRDVTVDATRNILEKELQGFGEEMRRRSLEVTPYSILSRATAGARNKTFILNLPGNPQGAVDCFGFVMKPFAFVVPLSKK
jgi:molybdenum cofactor synthesis domain-containing protein